MEKTFTKIEWRVVPITRYQVTRYEEGTTDGGASFGGSSSHGTFDNQETAYEVSYALASAEHTRLGWSVGDDRIQYPKDDPRYGGMTPVAAA